MPCVVFALFCFWLYYCICLSHGSPAVEMLLFLVHVRISARFLCVIVES